VLAGADAVNHARVTGFLTAAGADPTGTPAGALPGDGAE